MKSLSSRQRLSINTNGKSYLKKTKIVIMLLLAFGFFKLVMILEDTEDELNNALRLLDIQIEKAAALPSTEKGFHPVYVFNDPKLAASEMPERSKFPMRPNRKSPYSQVSQDKVILALTNANEEHGGEKNKMARKHFFFDLASNDPINLSNTLYLEQKGWNGICIEGNGYY